MIKTTAIICAALLLAGCSKSQGDKPTVKRQAFGNTADGAALELFTLTNQNGMEASITNYGGTVVSLLVPDRAGKKVDIVHGFDSAEGYLKGCPYFGATIGRYGNRIAKGRFTLDGVQYQLPINNGENSLHGGNKGFDKRVWKPTIEGQSLALEYLSKDGEEGYPGNLNARVVFTVTPENELKIAYTATTDKDTVINLTNHSYFNLAGQGDILGHQLKLVADRFTPIDAGLIPTGELRPIKGTPFDFTQPTAIGARINDNDEQLRLGKGYDHNFVLNSGGGQMALAAEVYEPTTGRVMQVFTDQPGIQFYSGNFLDGSIRGKGGRVYTQRSGFCLETQHFPDSPNKPQFPSTVLKPGQRYQTTTMYKFSNR